MKEYRRGAQEKYDAIKDSDRFTYAQKSALLQIAEATEYSSTNIGTGRKFECANDVEVYMHITTGGSATVEFL